MVSLLFLYYNPSYNPILGDKCTKLLQNDLDVFKVLKVHMHTTYTPKAQIYMFICFAKHTAVLELRPNFVKTKCSE